ncbi:hypothetical protein R3P38DRAFT_3091108 [Favolaschia claudopus]|uniref:Cullin N-terminal domain-containing protein n=1 Tax=Favolaschia claudopus TaxID=2862362 RepID=A0AAV9ZSB1_9AGAR
MDQKTWKADLDSTITRMLTEGGPLTFVEYTSAYAAIYNHMTKSDGSSSVRDRQAELYARAENLFDNYTKEIGLAAPSDIEDVVPYYDSEWDRFSCGADAVDRVFTYLDRYDESLGRRTRGQDSIRNLLFQSWKENVFKPLTSRIEGTSGPAAAHIEHIRNLLASNKLSVKKFKEMRLGVALPAE